MTFFEVKYQKNGHVLKTKLLFHKRKVYLLLWNSSVFGNLD